MKNCIILGSGRSGTSMVAGTLAQAGYYMGDTLLPPTEANPVGYYESREVEDVNDGLIRSMLYPVWWERVLHRLRLKTPPIQPNFGEGEAWAKSRWLALIPPWRRPQPKPRYLAEIQRLTGQTPFCFKDPRFSYTLYTWRPCLRDAVFICVFRDPAVTAASIHKELEQAPYLAGITLRFEDLVSLWTYTYRHNLDHHRHEGEWLFLHYDQVLSGEGLQRLETLTGATVNHTFPDSRLRRTRSTQPVPALTRRVYDRLCTLAGYHPTPSLPTADSGVQS